MAKNKIIRPKNYKRQIAANYMMALMMIIIVDTAILLVGNKGQHVSVPTATIAILLAFMAHHKAITLNKVTISEDKISYSGYQSWGKSSGISTSSVALVKTEDTWYSSSDIYGNGVVLKYSLNFYNSSGKLFLQIPTAKMGREGIIEIIESVKEELPQAKFDIKYMDYICKRAPLEEQNIDIEQIVAMEKKNRPINRLKKIPKWLIIIIAFVCIVPTIIIIALFILLVKTSKGF